MSEELEVKVLSTAEQRMVFEGLKEGEEFSIGELAEKLNMSHSQVSKVVERLEGKGIMVAKRVGPQKMVQLAPEVVVDYEAREVRGPSVEDSLAFDLADTLEEDEDRSGEGHPQVTDN